MKKFITEIRPESMIEFNALCEKLGLPTYELNEEKRVQQQVFVKPSAWKRLLAISEAHGYKKLALMIEDIKDVIV